MSGKTTPTRGMADNDHLSDTENTDGVGKDGVCGIVGCVELVRDVSVDEDVTGTSGEDDGFGDSGVGACMPAGAGQERRWRLR